MASYDWQPNGSPDELKTLLRFDTKEICCQPAQCDYKICTTEVESDGNDILHFGRDKFSGFDYDVKRDESEHNCFNNSFSNKSLMLEDSTSNYVSNLIEDELHEKQFDAELLSDLEPFMNLW